MKPNFVLTPNTVNTFLERFKKMLSITNVLVVQSEYTGAKDINSMCKRLGIKSVFIKPVVRTQETYIESYSVKYDSYPSGMSIDKSKGIIIRPNEDSCIVFHFGEKFKFTPNRIYRLTNTLDKVDKITGRLGSKAIIRPFHDTAKAYNENMWTNEQSRSYWNDVANETYDY
jgi:hypothetical protein